MLAEKKRDFQPHVVNLEALVPLDNFYRRVEEKLDLCFVRDLVQSHYSSRMGRPSIDPVVFFKLQLIMFFEGIRSERQLMAMVNMRLDHRWYIGYDLNEEVPDHSSLSKIRDRYGLSVFQQFFEKIVDLCLEVGLVWGKELHFDASISEANADYDNQIPRFYWQAQQHTQALFEQADRHFVHKYDNHLRVSKESNYKRLADQWVNPTDPDATPMGQSKLGYRIHYGIDGGKARIIMSCLVTPSTIQDNAPLIDLVWRTRFRWQLPLKQVVADTKYGTSENLIALGDAGIMAFMAPVANTVGGGSTKYFQRSDFEYEAEQDRYICPQGEILSYRQTYNDSRHYRPNGGICPRCPLKPQCTRNKRWRVVSHSVHKAYIDRVTAYQQTEAYRKAMRKRQVWVEPKFGEVKQWHQGRRFRLRGIWKVNAEALIRAAGQNIKQLLNRKSHSNTPKPPAHEAIPQLIWRFFQLPVLLSTSIVHYLAFPS